MRLFGFPEQQKAFPSGKKVHQPKAKKGIWMEQFRLPDQELVFRKPKRDSAKAFVQGRASGDAMRVVKLPKYDRLYRL